MSILRVLAAACVAATAGCAGTPYPATFLEDAVAEGPPPAWVRDLGRGVEHTLVPYEGDWLAAVAPRQVMRVGGSGGETVWSRKVSATPVTSPLPLDGAVVVGCDYPAPVVVALDPRTGDILWRRERAGPLVAGRAEVLVAVAAAGSVQRLDAATGEPLWTVRLEGAGGVPPLLAGEDVVVVAVRPDSLVALGLEDGHRRWAARAGFRPGLAATDPGIVAVSDDGRVALLGREDGALRAESHLAAIPSGPPVPAGDVVVVACSNGLLVAMDGRDLATRWTRRFDPPLPCAPAAGEGLLAQAVPRGRVLLLDVVDGADRGMVTHRERLLAPPRFEGGTLLVAGGAGTLLAFSVPEVTMVEAKR